jgi:hypothetical protein
MLKVRVASLDRLRFSTQKTQDCLSTDFSENASGSIETKRIDDSLLQRERAIKWYGL